MIPLNSIYSADLRVGQEKLIVYINYLENKKYMNETERTALVDLKELAKKIDDVSTYLHYNGATGIIG